MKVAEHKRWTSDLAYHEAGHGVIAIALGIPVRRATIQPSYVGDGYVKPDCDIKKIDMDAMLLVYLAGGAAERKHTGRPAKGDGRDRENASLFASAMGPLLETDEKAAELRLARYQVLADAYVIKHWGWIERTARALLKKGTLDGKQIELLRR